MTKRVVRFFPMIFLLALFLPGEGLFAFGRKEAPAEAEPVNTEWVLCITDPDVSTLPVSRQISGTTVVRSLANTLSNLSFRFRGEEESAYYRDYAWAKSRSAAAKALAAKQSERDLLIYRGDPSWRYKKNLKAVDDAIAKLEDDLAGIDALAPAVEAKPVFTLTEGNVNGTYPAPPEPGGEYRFCTDQKADAFLTETLSEYHGRIYLKIRMYTLFTRSYSFEDSILFSSEDLNEAVDEISGRLAAAVSEALPSAILVHATPPDAMVLIDGALEGMREAGQVPAEQTPPEEISSGQTPPEQTQPKQISLEQVPSGQVPAEQVPQEIHIRSPGTVEVAVRADNYNPVSFPVELKPGELADLYIELTPLSLTAFDIEVPGNPGSKVYMGGLYVGETPLTLELPKSQFAYISVETPDEDIGTAVFRDNSLVKGSSQFIRKGDASGTALFSTKTPVNPEEKRVDRARRGFYGVYGAFWFILPASLITAGIAGTYIIANNLYAGTPGADLQSDAYKRIYDNALTGRNVQIAAYSVMGAALGVTFFQIFRYLYVSGADATPIVKVPPNETRTAP